MALLVLDALVFLVTISIGALAWLMLQHLTRAVWSVVIRRLLENLTRPLPLLAVWLHPHRTPPAADLFLGGPVASGRVIPHWPQGGLARSHVLQHAGSHLPCDPGPAIGGCWRESRPARTRRRRRRERRMRAISSWGLVLLALTSSFAGFDWLMSLIPTGLRRFSASTSGRVARRVAGRVDLADTGPPRHRLARNVITTEHLHDLGKLLFGFVVFWTYIAFCQYFLIWYADFPEETGWYITRRSGSWNTLSWALFRAFPRAILLAPVPVDPARPVLARVSRRPGSWCFIISISTGSSCRPSIPRGRGPTGWTCRYWPHWCWPWCGRGARLPGPARWFRLAIPVCPSRSHSAIREERFLCLSVKTVLLNRIRMIPR